MTGTYSLSKNNPELGFVGENVKFVENFQKKVFSQLSENSDKQDIILDSQQKTEQNTQDIKEIVTGDAELKNMTNADDLTVVKELNARTVNKDAKRIAIIYFDNTSEDKKLDRLKKGLTGMLISDLSNINMLDIVERDRLEELLKEQKLSNYKGFDNATVAKGGKLLGAEIILTGTYFEMFGSIRIDARFIDVETGEILKSEGVDGQTANFFKLEKQLAWKIINNMDVKLSKDERTKLKNNETNQEVSYDDTILYASALDEIDGGNIEKALTSLKEIIERNPNFQPALEELEKIEVNL